jgi:hypothetical protein
MAVKSDAVAANCVRLVIEMLTDSGGDHAIIRSDRVPVMTRDRRRYRISDTALPRTTVARIAQSLLPPAELTALAEIGETRFHLSYTRAMGGEDFIVNVIDRAGDLCVDIEHHKLPTSDDVPEELFQTRRD